MQDSVYREECLCKGVFEGKLFYFQPMRAGLLKKSGMHTPWSWLFCLLADFTQTTNLMLKFIVHVSDLLREVQHLLSAQRIGWTASTATRTRGCSSPRVFATTQCTFSSGKTRQHQHRRLRALHITSQRLDDFDWRNPLSNAGTTRDITAFSTHVGVHILVSKFCGTSLEMKGCWGSWFWRLVSPLLSLCERLNKDSAFSSLCSEKCFFACFEVRERVRTELSFHKCVWRNKNWTDPVCCWQI